MPTFNVQASRLNGNAVVQTGAVLGGGLPRGVVHEPTPDTI
jgi:hypothetical protein